MTTHWKADRYEIRDRENRIVNTVGSWKSDSSFEHLQVAVSKKATWKRYNPFHNFTLSTLGRSLEGGPHLNLLRLRSIWKTHDTCQRSLPPPELLDHLPKTRKLFAQNLKDASRQSQLLHNSQLLFAKAFGLIGAFETEYVGTPVLPPTKSVVAPDALITANGKLKRIDPDIEGRTRLVDLLAPRNTVFTTGHVRSLDADERKVARKSVALPSEASFIRKSYEGDYSQPQEVLQAASWDEMRRTYGAVIVLDEESWTGTSVVCTREPLRYWRNTFLTLPEVNAAARVDPTPNSLHFLNEHLSQASPQLALAPKGPPQREWRYRGLLQAISIMLYLDLSGGTNLKECQSRGCSNYFNAGTRDAMYCSKRCASRAATRRSRGQNP